MWVERRREAMWVEKRRVENSLEQKRYFAYPPGSQEEENRSEDLNQRHEMSWVELSCVELRREEFRRQEVFIYPPGSLEVTMFHSIQESSPINSRAITASFKAEAATGRRILLQFKGGNCQCHEGQFSLWQYAPHFHLIQCECEGSSEGSIASIRLPGNQDEWDWLPSNIQNRALSPHKPWTDGP